MIFKKLSVYQIIPQNSTECNLSANSSLFVFAKAYIFAIIKSVPIQLPSRLPKLDFWRLKSSNKIPQKSSEEVLLRPQKSAKKRNDPAAIPL